MCVTALLNSINNMSVLLVSIYLCINACNALLESINLFSWFVFHCSCELKRGVRAPCAPSGSATANNTYPTHFQYSLYTQRLQHVSEAIYRYLGLTLETKKDNAQENTYNM